MESLNFKKNNITVIILYISFVFLVFYIHKMKIFKYLKKILKTQILSYIFKSKYLKINFEREDYEIKIVKFIGALRGWLLKK